MSHSSPKTPLELVLGFPGQGAYGRELLGELFGTSRPVFEAADAHCRRMLGAAFLPLVEASSEEEHDRYLASHPDLDQVGIYLGEALAARALLRRGAHPTALLGHSLGDLAALASAGVFSIDDGLRIVCQRVLSIREIGSPGKEGQGKMAALSVGEEKARALLAELAPEAGGALEIAVVNHPWQTVLSGDAQALAALKEPLAQRGVSLTLLKSRYPFHSSRLEGAVKPFEIALRGYDLAPPRIPVFLSTEGRLIEAGDDLPALLARQFVTRLDYLALLRSLSWAEDATFIECAPGKVLAKILARGLRRGKKSPDQKLHTYGIGGGARGLAELLEEAERRQEIGAETPEASPGDGAGTGAGTRAVTEARRLLAQATALLAGAEGPSPAAVTAPEPPPSYPDESGSQPPIAIVAMGCVLPGAGDADEFWHNVDTGVSGIADLAQLDPVGSGDFLLPPEERSEGGEPRVVSDKTYTLLNGAIPEVPYPARLLGDRYSEEEFQALSKGQRLLAVALAQCGLRAGGELPASRMRCILGATADGFAEYDEAMVLQALTAQLSSHGAAPETTSRAVARLERMLGRRTNDAWELAQHRALGTVVDRMLASQPGGESVESYVVDTACSSSLYAINLGIKELLKGEADLVLAGGVFAPGPANNALFAQFRGLTPTGSRPLDATADGVVFGDGAAVVALKRLPDALAAGDRVLGVVRAMGLSCDGRSPSINVPRSPGQSRAIRHAYQASGVDPETIQYLEAHATATPVGDAVEFRSLMDVFGDRPKEAGPIELASVKSLTGHTGWVSGAASLIKILKAFEHRRVPRQYGFESTGEQIPIAGSPFRIATAGKEWGPNLNDLPRRAGINGFGFGGTNAHLVVEDFDEAYHRQLSKRCDPVSGTSSRTVAVVAASGLFPTAGGPGRFDRRGLRLPAKKILLPDVTEHMDPSQYLGALAAEEIFAELGEALEGVDQDVAVVLGLESKTERGVTATVRVFLDRLRRRLQETANGKTAGEEELLGAALRKVEEDVIPSGAYTLPGLMPNVTASRISSLFDLKGPNLVIDGGAASLAHALATGAELLAHGDSRLVLAGGINALGEVGTEHREAVLLLALTLPETAEEEGLPVIARLDLAMDPELTPEPPREDGGYRGATGAAEVLDAVNAARDGADRELVLPAVRGGARLKLAATKKAPAEAPPKAAAAAEPSASDQPAHTYDFVKATPIYRLTPRRRELPARSEPVSLRGKRLLVLAEEPLPGDTSSAGGITLLSPASSPVPGSLVIDPEAAEGALPEELAGFPFDAVVILQDLSKRPADGLLRGDPEVARGLLDLALVVVKGGYERIEAERLPVVSLHLGALAANDPESTVAPESGLFSGFLKSVARELPESPCRAVGTDRRTLEDGLALVEIEVGEGPGPVEVFHVGGRRFGLTLEPVEPLAEASSPILSADSVVLATGGGRGVTAVLAEDLLETFGCTVIALGRTDLDAVPPELLAMSPEELAAHEGEFYRKELAAGAPGGIKELKKRFSRYQAANELAAVVEECRKLPGRYEYRSVDITDPQALTALLSEIQGSFGRLDLVVHGAGVQISQLLPKKSLADFRRVVRTKLSSLSTLYQGCEEIFGAGTVHFHLLTSAFSYLGNDGQPDYGAANEAMNRLAETLGAGNSGRGATWSSLAWLGWAGIGMTRGTEFAALAARRRLRGVTREEGQQIFRELMAGRPAAAINVLLADGEIQFYGPAVDLDAPSRPQSPPQPKHQPKPEPAAATNGFSAPPSRPERQVTPLDLTLGQAPFLVDHQVKGVPTLPGAFIIGLAGEAALRLRPELKVISFEDTSFRRLVRVYPDKETPLRVESVVVSESSEETVVRVQLLADFVHKSGVVLGRDLVQTEIFVHLGAAPRPQPPGGPPLVRANGGLRLPDPYVMEGSPVCLNGRFRSLSEVLVEDQLRLARYRLADGPLGADGSNGGNGSAAFDYLVPNLILVDAFWRFGTVQPTGRRSLSVYVPERCRRMGVFFDYADFASDDFKKPVFFVGANPREDGDQLHVGPIEARDESGRLLLTVEGGICRKFGVIENAY